MKGGLFQLALNKLEQVLFRAQKCARAIKLNQESDTLTLNRVKDGLRHSPFSLTLNQGNSYE